MMQAFGVAVFIIFAFYQASFAWWAWSPRQAASADRVRAVFRVAGAAVWLIVARAVAGFVLDGVWWWFLLVAVFAIGVAGFVWRWQTLPSGLDRLQKPRERFLAVGQVVVMAALTWMLAF